ncbi:MAG: GNAT family N-acetyltransferase [Halobacteriovoraceae bacterium]|nr:GNAT family N-acetyltransferase [Halobacteriovoraceae bacterium]
MSLLNPLPTTLRQTKLFENCYTNSLSDIKFAVLEESSPHFSKMEEIFRSQIEPLYGNQDEALRKIRDRTDRRCEVLLYNDSPVGFVVYKKEKQREHEREGLADSFEVKSLVIIEPSDRTRETYGTMLVNRVMKLAQRNFAKNLYMTVSERDQKMVEFLRSKGFSVGKTWQDKYIKGVKEFLFQLNVPEKGKGMIQQSESEPRVEEKEVSRKRERSSSRDLEQADFSQPKKKSRPEKKASSVVRKDLHHLTMKKKYIHQIRNGEKTVEGRISKGAVLKYRPGDKIHFYYFTDTSDDVTCQIIDVKQFNTFKEMLVDSGFKSCIPDAANMEFAVKAYDQIPKYSEKAAKFGVTAIHLRVLI